MIIAKAGETITARTTIFITQGHATKKDAQETAASAILMWMSKRLVIALMAAGIMPVLCRNAPQEFAVIPQHTNLSCLLINARKRLQQNMAAHGVLYQEAMLG